MSEWISIKDRLPDVIGDYLCYDDGAGIAWAFFNSAKQWAYSHLDGDNGYYVFVTHWMPLPEPPKD